VTSQRDSDPDGGATLIGRLLGDRYRLDELLGQGAMGAVYRATPVDGSAAVAIKLLHAELLGNVEAVRRFKREARNAAALRDPYCVTVLEADRDPKSGDPYLVMELLQGRTLAEELRVVEPLPLPRVVGIVDQILRALEAAHASGIIHRDLKPANVMLLGDRGAVDRVKVCDFGVSKMVAAGGEIATGNEPSTFATAGGIIGTPEYMAPEQARGEEVDGRADLYATGVVLYQMLTGDLPFRATSPVGILARKLSEDPMPPRERAAQRGISVPLEEVTLWAMARDPTERPASARELRERLAEAFAGRTWHGIRRGGRALSAPADMRTLASTVRPGVRLAPPPRPRRAWRVAASAVIVAGAVGAFALARSRSTAEVATPPAAAPTPTMPAPRAGPEASPAAAGPPPPAPAVVTAPAGARGATERPPSRRGPAKSRAAPGSSTAAAVATPAEPPPKASTPTPLAPADLLATAQDLIDHGRIRDACEAAEQVKARRADLAAVYKLLGQCYMRLGRSDEASANYRTYLRLSPRAPDADFIRAIVH
jgi:eukaryotic-like serine/threonine-protein kinase